MSLETSIPRVRLQPKNLVLGFVLFVYILFGLYTHSIFVNTKPDYDFQFYEAALTKALTGSDPYDIRGIGPAFLYPPPSLFVIEAFHLLSNAPVRYFLFGVANVLIVFFAIRQISLHFGYSLRDVWFWFPLAFFFAPFLATLQLGQINMITVFGIILFFVTALPWVAALGLTLGIITKVTPIAFLFYSFIRRDFRTIFYSVIILTVVIVAAGFRYGFSTYSTYMDVFKDLLEVFPLTQNSQSFEAKVWMVFQPDIAPSVVHSSLLFYMGVLVLLSGFLAAKSGDTVPLFIILGLVITVSPNLMWYHHYVFLLPPLLIWMAWQKLETNLILWVLTGMLIIQIDYYFLTTGFIIHLFVQCSILLVILQQYSKLRQARSLPVLSAA